MMLTLIKPELENRWEKIRSFPLDDINAKEPFSMALSNEMDWDSDFTKEAVSEYRKFMFLSSMRPDCIVPSMHIDTVWHLHLLYTRSYAQFCKEALDVEFIHHQPGSGNDGEDDYFRSLYVKTLEFYEEVFASKPPSCIWGGITN